MNIKDLPLIMVKCLILTIVIETLLAFILKVRNKKDFFNIVIVNVITNPIVVSLPIYFMIRYNYRVRMISLYILEVITVLVEGLIYYKVLDYKKINPFALSFLLNVSSFLIGRLIN